MVKKVETLLTEAGVGWIARGRVVRWQQEKKRAVVHRQ